VLREVWISDDYEGQHIHYGNLGGGLLCALYDHRSPSPLNSYAPQTTPQYYLLKPPLSSLPSVIHANLIIATGRSNWLTGVTLVSVYVLIATTYFCQSDV